MRTSSAALILTRVFVALVAHGSFVVTSRSFSSKLHSIPKQCGGLRTTLVQLRPALRFAKMMSSGASAAAGGAQPPQPNDLEVRDITDLICKADCYCLNQQSGATWENLFMGDDRLMLKSDADEQLLLHIGFMETVKLHSIDFVAPADDTAPLTVKLYINRQSMGFSDTDDMEPAQTLELTPDDLVAGSVSVLKFVKFQRVSGLSIFLADNNGAEQTFLSSVKFFGSSVAGTKMSEFKKVEEGR